jgi:GGDEF domain-containing protein
MDIVSIKKFLKPGKPKPEDYIRFIQLLLQGIELHAVEADALAFSQFRQNISTVSGRLSEQSGGEEILAAMGVVIRTMSEYNQVATRVSQAHLRELQAMLVMTTETIAFLSESSNTGVERLHALERNIRKASSIHDVRELRGKLVECLTLVRNESNRLRDESNTRISALREGVEHTVKQVRTAGLDQPVDPATGLHGRAAAEEQIAANISQGKDFAVTLFLVDRLAHFNGRFGRKTGDEVLLQVAQHIGQRLETASLFRWSGPAFAAVMDIRTTFTEVERQMKRIASLRLEKTIATDGRFVLFPVTCSYLLQKVLAGDSADVVARNLDRFVCTHIGEGGSDSEED